MTRWRFPPRVETISEICEELKLVRCNATKAAILKPIPDDGGLKQSWPYCLSKIAVALF